MTAGLLQFCLRESSKVKGLMSWLQLGNFAHSTESMLPQC